MDQRTQRFCWQGARSAEWEWEGRTKETDGLGRDRGEEERGGGGGGGSLIVFYTSVFILLPFLGGPTCQKGRRGAEGKNPCCAEGLYVSTITTKYYRAFLWWWWWWWVDRGC